MAVYMKGTRVSESDVHNHNPSVSEKQRRFMAADLRREQEGKKTRTDMSEGQLEDYARKKKD